MARANVAHAVIAFAPSGVREWSAEVRLGLVGEVEQFGVELWTDEERLRHEPVEERTKLRDKGAALRREQHAKGADDAEIERACHATRGQIVDNQPVGMPSGRETDGFALTTPSEGR